MCLLAFSWQPDEEDVLTLVANRDEFYQRPTLPVHFWEDHDHILGGKDLEAKGSWLAVSRKGRFAALTNYREVPPSKGKREAPPSKGKISRGALVKDFLAEDASPEAYLSSIIQNKDRYAGFNLLLGTQQQLYYYSNRLGSDQFQTLSPGIYGLCNSLLDTPWPKLLAARNQLAELLHAKALPEQFIEMMRDSSQAKDELLPETGIGTTAERLLSSCFIASDNYGTRNTSVIRLHQSGALQWTEQNYQPAGEAGVRLFFEMTLNQHPD